MSSGDLISLEAESELVAKCGRTAIEVYGADAEAAVPKRFERKWVERGALLLMP